MIATIIADLLSDPKTPVALKVRILRLFGATIFEHEELHKTIIAIAFEGEMVFLRESAKGMVGDFVEADLQGHWLQDVAKIRGSRLSTDSYDVFLYLLSRYRGTRLPSEVKNIILHEATTDSSNSSKSLDAISRFYNPIEAIDYFAQIALKAKNSDVRRESIKLMGSYQGKPNIEWQAESWQQLFDGSVDFPQQDRLSLLAAIASTETIQGVALLEKSLEDKDRRVQKAAVELLESLAECEDSALADAANEALDRRHSSPISE